MHKILFLTLLGLALAGCRHTPPLPITPTAEVSATSLPGKTGLSTASPSSIPPTLTAIPSPTKPPLSPVAIFLAPPGEDEGLNQSRFEHLQQITLTAGLQWEQRAALNASDLPPGLRLVIAVPPAQGLTELALAAPQVQFLALDFANLQPTSNLSVANLTRYDQAGFLAGVIAAALTPDWRVAAISVSDTVAGKAARNGFLNGAAYFCGLCNPYHGPIFNYPLYVELPSQSGSEAWQAAAQTLLDQSVQTIYLGPGAVDTQMLQMLAQNKVILLGSQAMPASVQSNWAASLIPDEDPAYELLPRLLNGEGNITLDLPVKIAYVNQVLFSPGKQRLVENVLADLLSGYIDTGVDPLTGEVR